MRKGALKKKQRQLEELHLDRREALGELVLGMYVQGSWDDDLMARGAAEVREVERELALLAGPTPDPKSDEPDSTELDFPATGEYTAEHDFPATGEYTAEHDLPPTGEHVLRPPSDHTEEHLLPSWRDATPLAPEAATPDPKPEPDPPAEKAPEPKPAASKTPVTPSPAPTTPEVKAPAKPKKPPTVAPTPSATAPVSVPAAAAAEAPAEKPAPASSPAPAPTPATEDPLARLSEKIDADQRRARNAIETAKATLKSESRTELTVISEEVASDRKKLASTLQAASQLISEAENRATAAEAKMTRETAAGREAAAGWVRTQAAEIEADAALAVELEQEGGEAPESSGSADQVLSARVASLEAELAAEKAARTEAIVTAQARLKEIEAHAKAAEERVAAAETAAAAATVTATATDPEPAPASDGLSEAEAREAAVAWLRGQIAALRKELGGQSAPDPNDASAKGDS